MSSASGITATDELVTAYAQAEQNNVRFLKISIQNEQLVLDRSVAISGSFGEDLNQLQHVLEDDIPAYVLARLDDGKPDYLFVSYVPDAAKVRDKMLYASTRAALTKALGAFSDSLFATSKSDLTPDAYEGHRRHVAAASPMSAREAEMAALRAAERAAGDDIPRGMSARSAHVDSSHGIAWDSSIEEVVKDLGAASTSKLLILSIDVAAEKLVLISYVDATVDGIASKIPASDPSYALFSWHHSPSGEKRRDVVFIYSCPSSSPVKSRMLYSTSIGVLINQIKALGVPVAKRIETSDRNDLDAASILSHLGLEAPSSGASTPAAQENRAFARPKGPGRKR
ncbi:actin depolymerizing protein [Auriculariales sp. MPI-PUGE-AT-0066]|nr:actin depolymerizing protein [Auriculariales sp. MPI-PUGE-AT-0066]